MTTTIAETRPAAAPLPDEPDAHRYWYHVISPPKGDRVGRFLAAFAAILTHSNYRALLDQYLAASAKCSRCTTTCPVYQVTGDPRDIPCHRTNLLLATYRRHFTLRGHLRARLTGDPGITEETIDEMAELFYRCTACRRCRIECPLGIDHAIVTHLGRWVLGELRIVPKGLEISVIEQLHGESGNTSGILPHALVDTLEFLEEEIEEMFGVPMKFPVDEKGRDYVFFPAVSDYLMEPETLMGNLVTLYAAGELDRFTIGTGYFDGINYGLFYSDHVLERVIRKLVEETKRLSGKNILIGECGHASRSARDFVPVFGGAETVPVVNFMELTDRYVAEGKLDLDPDAIPERVTYHDPCNIARSNWIVKAPRRILRSFVRDFVEMEPHGVANYCCGGGGGTVSVDEIHDFRMEVAGRTKADQIRATGAQLVVAPCANCKKQLKELCEYHELGAEVVGLHDLILRAIRIPGARSPAERNATEATA